MIDRSREFLYYVRTIGYVTSLRKDYLAGSASTSLNPAS